VKVRVFHCRIPNIKFGSGTLEDLSRLEKSWGTKALLAADPYLDKAGVVDEVVRLLKKAGVEVVKHTEITPNPDCFAVDRAAESARLERCSFVVGLGGGSAIDFGKAVAVVAANPGKSWEYTERTDHEVRRPGESTLPIVAVPTTAGTGTEATPYSVLNNSKIKEKSTIVSNRVVPKLGIVDPELTLSMPPRLTAYTGIDTLAHSIDSYVSARAQPFSRLLSLESIRLVARWLPEAVASGANRAAREMMSWASTLGGMAIGHAGTTLPHALGQPVSGIFGAPHGGSIAACLVRVMQFSFTADFQRYGEIAEALDSSVRDLPLRQKAEASAQLVERLFRDTGTTVRYSDFGMREKDVDKATHIALTGYGGDIKIHPRIATKEEVKQLYRDCL
jgi:alcohol dehydrogenase class IV